MKLTVISRSRVGGNIECSLEGSSASDFYLAACREEITYVTYALIGARYCNFY